MWRNVARAVHADPSIGLYTVCSNASVIARLREYDRNEWCYGEDDDYANMDGPDRVIAALWLALEAEDEAKERAP